MCFMGQSVLFETFFLVHLLHDCAVKQLKCAPFLVYMGNHEFENASGHNSRYGHQVRPTLGATMRPTSKTEKQSMNYPFPPTSSFAHPVSPNQHLIKHQAVGRG